MNLDDLGRRLDDAVAALEGLADSLATIATCVDVNGTIRTRDVDRAKVYGEHLGERMRET